MTIEELIAALERAEGPSRELELRIARDVLDSEPLGHAAGLPDDLLLFQPEYGPWPHYTASIDAALWLVPKGVGWGVKKQQNGEFAWCDGDIARAGNVAVRGGATPAIALCIAALKARAAT